MTTTTTSFGEEYKLEDEEEDVLPRCDWDFHLSTVVSNSSSSSDSIGAIDFSPSSSPSPRLLATAGIARKIRIYSASTLLTPPDDDGDSAPRHVSSSCELCICAPAKLSSVRFRPDSAGRVVGCGDYDGVVTEYDVERGVGGGAPLLERDEHDGRRVWAIDYSSHGHLAASASDDCTAHVWDSRTGETVAVARSTNAVCCVEFDPIGGPWLAVGGADRKAYVYDVRQMGRGRVWEMAGHTRAVTYVRFAGEGGRMVTSAADGTHRLWEPGLHVREYAGHVSGRSFVGMGVWRGGGLIASGSESNEVFVYDLRWGLPIWVKGFNYGGSYGGSCGNSDEKGFVSAVCWWQEAEEEGEMGGVLVAGGSDGLLQVFHCKRRELMDLD